MKPTRPDVACGHFDRSEELPDLSTRQTALQRVDGLTPKEVSARLTEILRAYRRKLLGLPGGASPNIREWRKLLKFSFAHGELTEYFGDRGLSEKEYYSWPIGKGYGKAFTLFDSGLDHRGAAKELGISEAHARVLRSRWRRAKQSRRGH
jgi:hypothetical protein